jgi:hypothetical protein
VFENFKTFFLLLQGLEDLAAMQELLQIHFQVE